MENNFQAESNKSKPLAKTAGPGAFRDLKWKELVTEALVRAKSRVAPLWETRDYVAVNPLFGYRGESFLKAIKKNLALTGVLLLPDRQYLKARYENSDIEAQDLLAARGLVKSEISPELFQELDHQSLVTFLDSAKPRDLYSVRIHCVSDLYDAEHGTMVTGDITREVSKWAAAYYDDGQSLWRMPGRTNGLFSAWRNLIVYEGASRPFHFGLKNILEQLSTDPQEALVEMCALLQEESAWSSERLEDYFLRLFATISGWSSLLRKNEFEADRGGLTEQGQNKNELTDLLAIRLAYDIALMGEDIDFESMGCWNGNSKKIEKEIVASWIWLMAHEASVRRNIASCLTLNAKRFELVQRPLAQFAFCIDVRSEIMRRKLEQASDQIQTIGFAGFFGLPISVQRLGYDGADPQCPVLIAPAFEIKETSPTPGETALKRRLSGLAQLSLKRAQASANSSFSLAETFGVSYALKMWRSGLKGGSLTWGLGSKQECVLPDLNSLAVSTRLQLAHSALVNMGLTHNFAKYVFLMGHGGESVNNPYQSALDCGACAGHNGQFNSQVLAGLLNESSVREGLREKGIEIPQDTVFFSGWHNTTRDRLFIDGFDEVAGEEGDGGLIQRFMTQAENETRLERSTWLMAADHQASPQDVAKELQTRARDWSEVRPEWGLARNHSFIVGRRRLTRGVDLGGRSFLHDYDEVSDHGLKRLELIMTAPMIVTNWINMQYYASTIDTERYGAGNKTISNVVGTIGCLQGNESDLMGGLAEQSVRFKGKYFHEPVRLQVFIEASTSSIDQIISKNQMVQDLVHNEWLNIISVSPQSGEFQLRRKNGWVDLHQGLWSWLRQPE